MYFAPQVKEKKEDFFNFEALQEELRMILNNKLLPLVVVHGLRRTGKTSLIKVVLNSLKKKHIWIDGRSISSNEDFYQRLKDETQKLKFIKIKSISIKGIEFGVGSKNEGFDHLNKHKVVLVIDEAQLLKRIHLDNVIAFIYDNYPNIKIVLSGSESGMLMNFLGKNNAKAPLYGRAIIELETDRLDKEKAYLFLKKGAKQAKITLSDEEIRETTKKLAGIIGWLTKYGWHRLSLPHKQALKKSMEEGKYIIKEEFLKFAVRSEKKYSAIIKATKGGSRWEEIKNETRISDKQLSSMLKRLINYGFIEKHNKIYTIADPLLEAAF